MAKFYTTKELADYLQVTPLTIRRKSLKGEIPSIKIGNRLRFDRDQIDAWLLGMNARNKLRVLVIDDEETVGQFITRTLKKTEYEVTVCLSGKDAVSVIRTGGFDVVFLDLKLPELDGADIFKVIREHDADVPVTIITGYPDSTIMNKAMQYGPFTVLKKPFGIEDVLKTVENMRKVAV